jgi:hypothetical protein
VPTTIRTNLPFPKEKGLTEKNMINKPQVGIWGKNLQKNIRKTLWATSRHTKVGDGGRNRESKELLIILDVIINSEVIDHIIRLTNTQGVNNMENIRIPMKHTNPTTVITKSTGEMEAIMTMRKGTDSKKVQLETTMIEVENILIGLIININIERITQRSSTMNKEKEKG